MSDEIRDLLAGLDQEAEEAYREGLGRHVLGMIDTAAKGKEDPAGSIFDAVGRARLGVEGVKE